MANIENNRTEYKVRFDDDGFKLEIAVVGFLNAQGGMLIYGIDDKGKVVGIANPDELQQKITNRITDNVKPNTLATKETTKEITKETTKETAGRILGTLRGNPYITAQEMANIIGLSPDGVRWNMNKLKKQGKIEHKGPTKGGYWKVIEE